MTKTDIARASKITLAALLYFAAFVMIVAWQNEMLDQFGKRSTAVALILAGFLIIGITLYWARSIGMVKTDDGPVAPSAKKRQSTLLVAGIFGAVIGFGFVFTGDLRDGGADLFSNKPIAPIAAVVFSLLYAIGNIGGYLRWRRIQDEYERAAVTTGAYAGLMTYLILAPLWWLLERASLVPQQQPMLVFAVVLIVYAAVWTYKRGE